MDKKYYVYVYLDPRKKGLFTYREYIFEYEPFYVGKGCYNRYRDHINESKNLNYDDYKHRKIRKIYKQTGIYPIIIKFKNNLSEKEAYSLERDLISTIKRWNVEGGPLVNIVEGGRGPNGLYGELNPFYGKTHSEKTKNIIRNKKLGVSVGPMSEETKEKLRKVNIGKILTKDHKQKISITRKNSVECYNATKKMIKERTDNENWKNKIREKALGRKFSQQTKIKLSKLSKGNDHGSKYYKIGNGKIEFVIKNLTSFCKENNLNHNSLLYAIYKGNTYQNFNIEVINNE